MFENCILFTGGGSAGHVTPNLALIKRCQASGWKVVYAGSKNGIERKIIKTTVPYYAITTDKLRRYFSWQSFLTPFKVMCGIVQSFLLCFKLKPHLVFSKGGFVALPVVIGAWLNRIPVVIHESDRTPGLANRLSAPFARLICISFSSTADHFKNKSKLLFTGTPIRASLLQGKAERGLAYCNLVENKPILLVMGGGQGSEYINRMTRRLLPVLLNTFQVVHLCGHRKKESSLENLPGYCQFDYLDDALADVMACADLIVSRAGANTLHELLTLKKPHILIPLSKKTSRGDQIANAQYFAEQGLSIVLQEDSLTDEKFLTTLITTHQDSSSIQKRLSKFSSVDSVAIIYNKFIELIENLKERN